MLGPRGNHTQARDYPCDNGPFRFYPFEHEPDNGQAALLWELPSSYDVYGLANISNLTATNAIPNIPPESFLNRVFGPVSPELNPTAGGLGIYRPDYMRLASNGTDYFHAIPVGHVCGGQQHGGWSNR